MPFRIHLTEQSGRLTSFRDRIEKIVSKIESEVGARMSLPDIDVVISDDPMGAIPETGVGGMARNEHLLLISIDPFFVFSFLIIQSMYGPMGRLNENCEGRSRMRCTTVFAWALLAMARRYLMR